MNWPIQTNLKENLSVKSHLVTGDLYKLTIWRFFFQFKMAKFFQIASKSEKKNFPCLKMLSVKKCLSKIRINPWKKLWLHSYHLSGHLEKFPKNGALLKLYSIRTVLYGNNLYDLSREKEIWIFSFHENQGF